MKVGQGKRKWKYGDVGLRRIKKIYGFKIERLENTYIYQKEEVMPREIENKEAGVDG